LRGLKIRTGRGTIALSGEEAAALKARLAANEATRSAAGTVSVSANASTSVTFTDTEKAAVLDLLEGWLDPAAGVGETVGLLALREALAQDLAGS
jgi:hypothetical protein